MRTTALWKNQAAPRTAASRGRSGKLLVSIAALALTMSACGSGAGSGADAGADSGDQVKTDAGDAGTVSNSAALEYIAGKAGAADTSKDPIVIGYVGQEGGIPSWPESSVAVKAAAEYINAELGGVDGHPLELKTCFVVSSEEDGQKCGQEMANDPDVLAVVTGGMVVGNASLYRTIGDTKAVLGTPSTLPDYVAPNNYNLLGSGFSVLPVMAIYAAQNLGAKNVAMVYADEPGGQAAAGLVKSVLDKYGVTLTNVPVPTTSTDLIGAITAAKAQSSDAFLAVVTAPLCTQIAKAQAQLGLKVPVIATGLCTDQAVSEALGDLPEWSYGYDTASPFISDPDPQAATFAAKVRQYGGDDANLGGFSPHPFAKLMTVVKLLNELGADKATSKSLTAAVAAFEGPLWMGPPTLKCGALADTPAICNTSARIYDYHGDGEWTDATDGEWIDIANPPTP